MHENLKKHVHSAVVQPLLRLLGSITSHGSVAREKDKKSQIDRERVSKSRRVSIPKKALKK